MQHIKINNIFYFSFFPQIILKINNQFAIYMSHLIIGPLILQISLPDMFGI